MLRLFIGTYTRKEPHVDGRGQGIYTVDFNTDTGEWGIVAVNSNVGINPTFICRSSSSKPLLYVVNECQDGKVAVYSYNSDGILKLQDIKSSVGEYPCHVTVNGPATHLAVTNYAAGGAIIYELNEEGTLATQLQHQEFPGASLAIPERQESSHPHSSMWMGDNLLIADLGTDKIWQMDGKKEYDESISCPAGSGPRYMTKHSNDQWLYVAHELDNRVHMYSKTKDGSWTLQQSCSTLEDTFDKANLCSHIEMTQCGRYLYCSNRGDDSIACFEVNQNDGRLKQIAIVSTQGRFPRHFTIFKQWMFVANQNSDSVVVFEIDYRTGMIQSMGNPIDCPSPVCLTLI